MFSEISSRNGRSPLLAARGFRTAAILILMGLTLDLGLLFDRYCGSIAGCWQAAMRLPNVL
jgi:hypothetical protein